MNKKKMLVIALIIALTSISFFSGSTFAKYLTSYNASASLDVAKWSVTEEFLVNGKSAISENIKLATTYSPKTLVDGKIAPGTNGSFGVKIDATGTETGLSYQIKFSNITGTKPENLVFRYNNKYYSDLASLSEAINKKAIIEANATNKILNILIVWSWPYETLDSKTSKPKDAQDTLDGQNSLDYSFDITITCTQNMPTVYL